MNIKFTPFSISHRIVETITLFRYTRQKRLISFFL